VNRIVKRGLRSGLFGWGVMPFFHRQAKRLLCPRANERGRVRCDS
jgi:hypothetical protein